MEDNVQGENGSDAVRRITTVLKIQRQAEIIHPVAGLLLVKSDEKI